MLEVQNTSEDFSVDTESEDSVIFSKDEWKYFIKELQMRGVDKIAQCVNNARYLARLDEAIANIKAGRWTEHELIEDDDDE